MTCRLLRHPPASGAWNMAVDEVLLDGADGASSGCWRFYAWDEPTLSLGYFQECRDRFRHDSSRKCPVVRRLTGGGAILHDAELTYSLVLPGGHRLATRRDLLYQAVHESLIAALDRIGISASLCGGANLGSELPRPNGQEPFLCFQRRSPGDVLVGETKIAGSAQRRRNGAVLQHGSLLLRRSPAAPELPGLEEVAGRPISVEELSKNWLGEAARRLGTSWSEDALNEQESGQAQSVAKARYGSLAWTESKGRQDRHAYQENL